MIILHATKRYPKSTGGDATVVAQLEAAQTKAGHQVLILTSNCPDIVTKPHVLKFGLPIGHEAIDRFSLNRLISLAWLSLKSFYLLKKQQPDLIHSHSPDIGFALSFAARCYRVPMISTSHGTTLPHAYHAGLKRSLERFLLKRAGYKAWVSVDSTALSAFRAAGFMPLSYIPNAVDTALFTQRRRHSHTSPMLLYVGRVEAAKGMQFLLDAFVRLHQTYPQLLLTIVGDGSQRPTYQQFVKEHGLAEVVTFAGNQPPSEVRKLYAQADIFVLPSLAEGLPLVLLEAWASQLPVVITKVGGIGAVCTDGKDALLIQPARSAAIVTAIAKLIDYPALAKKIARRGRKTVETKYTIASLSKAYEDLYQEVAA